MPCKPSPWLFLDTCATTCTLTRTRTHSAQNVSQIPKLETEPETFKLQTVYLKPAMIRNIVCTHPQGSSDDFELFVLPKEGYTGSI